MQLPADPELLERELLPAYLPKQRWFADKDASLGDVRVRDAVPLDAPLPSYLTIVTLPALRHDYFLPIAATHDGELYDGFRVDAFVRALLDDVRAERRLDSDAGSFVAHATAALRGLDLGEDVPIRRLSVEQSNTSVVIGDRVMLKGYRRVARAAQPELEVARFLDAVGYRNTPALLGYLEYEERDGRSALAIAQRFVPNAGDAWAVTLARLNAYFEDPDQPPERYDDLARALGRRVAELHRAFATPIGDPAFEPEPVRAEDVRAWSERARATAEDALARVERELERLPPDARRLATRLLASRGQIEARLAAPPLGDGGLVKTRYHGDLHLGQVLVVDADVMIVDFEGEPARDVETRRRKASPLLDVAGMLRSFDYAAISAMRAARERGAAGATVERAIHWRSAATGAFLDAYRTAIAGCPSVPSDPAHERALLELFALEKAFYELAYELANRPDWAAIPLEGIRDLLDLDRRSA